MKKAKEITFQPVFEEKHENGSSTFWDSDPSTSKHPRVVAIRIARKPIQDKRIPNVIVSFGDVVDLREPPWKTMSPCPWCDVLEDKHHNVYRHVDDRMLHGGGMCVCATNEGNNTRFQVNKEGHCESIPT